MISTLPRSLIEEATKILSGTHDKTLTESTNIVQLPQTNDVKTINKFIKDKSDIYVQNHIKLYHGTHPNHPIKEQGLLPTSSTRRLSLQSASGYVYLATTPEMAKQFGDIGNGINNSKVYEVTVPIHKLLADKDQLKNKRMYGDEDIGNSIGDSIIHGRTVRVKGKIEPWQIEEYKNI